MRTDRTAVNQQRVSPKPKSRLFLAIKITVTLCLLVILLNGIDLARLRPLWHAVRWPCLFWAYLVTWLIFLCHACRWQILLRAAGRALRYGQILQSFLVGYFFGHFLPSVVGGDAVRALHIARTGIGRRQSFLVILVARILGLNAVFLLLALCALAAPDLVHRLHFEVNALLILSLAVFALSLGGYVLLPAPFFLQWLERRVPFLGAVGGTLRHLRRETGAMAAAFGVSLGQNGLILWRYFLVAQALGLGLDFATLGVATILVTALTMIPITLNGLGLRETGFVYLLGLMGVSPEKALLFSLLNYALGMVMALAGGLCYLLEHPATAPPVPDPRRRP